MAMETIGPAETEVHEILVSTRLSPWWRYSALLIILIGLVILIYLSTIAYQQSRPIPKAVVRPDGQTIFTTADVDAGQQVFLKGVVSRNPRNFRHPKSGSSKQRYVKDHRIVSPCHPF